jgi:hypothetical protein
LNSFGAAKPARQIHGISSKIDFDQSQNHTFTIKYKTRSFLQMIGRVEKNQVKRDRDESPDLLDVPNQRVKVENEVVIVEDNDPLYIVDGVIVID